MATVETDRESENDAGELRPTAEQEEDAADLDDATDCTCEGGIVRL